MDRVFHISWDRGSMDLNVSEFFATSNVDTLKKFYRSVENFCGEKDRADLGRLIQEEITDRENAMRELEDLAARASTIRSRFPKYGTLKKQVKKLDKSLDLLKEARWDSVW